MKITIIFCEKEPYSLRNICIEKIVAMLNAIELMALSNITCLQLSEHENQLELSHI